MEAFLANPPPGANIYICLACHDGERKRSHVLYLSTLFMDVDVHCSEDVHPLVCYLVVLFCQTYGIPNPSFMVASGSGGIHVYWRSHVALPVDVWQTFADALKWAILDFDWQAAFNRGCSKQGYEQITVKVDAFVTADATRVLRVPGHDNYKHTPPRPVKVVGGQFSLLHDTVYNFEEKFAGLKERSLKKPDEGFVLGEVLEPNKLGPMPFAPIMAGCGFLRRAYETGGKDYTEPLWHMTTLCAAFLENGNELVHKFGAAHPGYSHESTEDKWEHACRARDDKSVGWPSCKTISDRGSGECQSCPHFAAGKTPFHLGLDALRDREDQQQLNELNAERPEELYLPRGYAISKATDYICKIDQKYNRKGQPVGPKYLMELFLCKISDPVPQTVSGVRGVSFFETSGKNPTVRKFVGVDEFEPDKLKKMGINNRSKNGKEMTTFGESWIDRMHRMKESRDLTSLGWRFEGGKITGFVYGGTYFKSDGTVISSGLDSENNVLKYFQPIGEKEAWYRAAKLLTDRYRPELTTLLCVGFAAPLMAFAGTIYGGILSVFGPAGTSKSTAQQLACSIWAHPKHGRESISSTKKSVLNKLGMIKNLPAYWDDIQDEIKQEHLFQTMFENTEGIEGSRLDTNVAQRARGDWQTLMVACSNASFCEYVIRKQPSTTAGLRRVLEYEISRIDELALADSFDAIKTYAELEHNYGGVGYGYAQLLATEHAQIEEMVGRKIKQFKDRVKGTPEETFWWGIAGVLVAGAVMALRMGVEGVDPTHIEEFLVGVFRKNRELRDREATEGGSKDNTWNALAQFLIHFIGKGHALRRNIDSFRGDKAIEVSMRPRDGCPLYIDIIEGEHKLRISKSAFRVHLREQKIEPRQVVVGLERHFGAKVDQFKSTLGRGTQWAVSQEDVIEIPIAGLLTDLLREVTFEEPPA